MHRCHPAGRNFPRALTGIAAACWLASPAIAATKLDVDLSATIGPVTHASSGSLYGVTETLPADVTALIAPLHPRMFNNPAADQQQPVGDAIVVAGRVAPLGAAVTIRLADWFKGFYTFTSMTDWFSKIDQTVSRKKAAGLTNIYAYEIWNEPGGTYASSNPLSFNEFWRQTFVHLRQVDPDVKITGPSVSYYDATFLNSFLSFCKTNSCLPDIVGWHELSGGNLTGNLQAYRALEKQLGIGPLPITINEYSGPTDIDVEGQPGASAPMIAKFERFQVDSACISYWDVAHAGRLGSLLATNTDPNGGWWFYKWYGDMTGNMVSTTAPTPASVTALDGFANLDATTRTASVLFGGVNDGTIQITVKGFQAAGVFGSTVHAVVEQTPFVNRTTVVKATTTISTADLSVTNDQIMVTVSNANNTSGYRLTLRSGEGGAGGGGTSGAGGAGGATAGSGGRSASGGAQGTGGVASTSSGGRAGAMGTGGGTAGSSTGGAMTGGSSASGGQLGTASGGQGSGGRPLSSGGTSTGGSGSGGNSAASGGASPATGASGGSSAGAIAEDGPAGCSCQVGSPFADPEAAGFAILLFVLARRANRNRARRSSR